MKNSNVPILYPFRVLENREYKLAYYFDYNCVTRECYFVHYKNIINGKSVGIFKMKKKN